MRIRRLLIAGVVAALAATVPAAAKPDRAVTLSAATPEHAWDGEQGQYTNLEYDVANCSKDATSYCEQILLEVRSDTPVAIDVSLTEFSPAYADFDLYLYKSDATGEAGEQIESPAFGDPSAPGACADYCHGGPPSVPEVIRAEGLAAGHYLLVVSHFINPNATYKGLVKVTGATGGGGAPPPSDGGGNTPPPSDGNTPPSNQPGATALPFKVGTTLGSAKRFTRKKAVSFKATASEAISNLNVSLVDSRKKTVAKARIASFAKGTRTIKMRARKLKAGRYSLVATGSVGGETRSVSYSVRLKR